MRTFIVDPNGKTWIENSALSLSNQCPSNQNAVTGKSCSNHRNVRESKEHDGGYGIIKAVVFLIVLAIYLGITFAVLNWLPCGHYPVLLVSLPGLLITWPLWSIVSDEFGWSD